jgi:hypothetical protein
VDFKMAGGADGVARVPPFFALFVLFAFFASTSAFIANSNFENVSRHQPNHSQRGLI